MFFPDLQTRQLDDSYCVRFVGWPSITKPFSQGSVSPDFIHALMKHVEEVWVPILYAGWHDCEFCVDEPDISSFDLCIPAGNILYFAPAMIGHYVVAHQYQPPQEFVEAVLTSPAQATPEFYSAIRPFAERWDLIHRAGVGGFCWKRRLSQSR